jgi:hypothetical protein
VKVEFYETTKLTDPATWGHNVVGEPELVYTYREGAEMPSGGEESNAVTTVEEAAE